jgi:hypothetical protein
MASFRRSSFETESISPSRRVTAERRPPQKQRVAKTLRAAAAQIKAAERRQIWEREAALFLFFTLFIDA